MQQSDSPKGLVEGIQQLCKLRPEAAEWINMHVVHFSFKKNQRVLAEGKTCNYLYYVDEGLLGGCYFNEDREICNWISVEHDLATSYYSFISRRPSYETIECFEHCKVTAISYERLNELYRLFPETERAGRLMLEAYYSRLEERLMAIQFKSSRERYEHLALTRPEIIKRAPLGRIATYLGMKQETLSRIRAGK